MGHEVQVYCRCGFKDRHTFINLGQTSELPLLFSSLLQFKKTMVTCVSSIRRFKEGISDTYKLVFGNWKKFGDGAAFFEPLKVSDRRANMDGSEVSFNFQYQNLDKEQRTIRRR